MKKFFFRHIVFLVALWSVHNSHSQTVDFTEINNQFKNHREQALQEKIYAHLDKPSYLAGEILWFKIYNVDASLNKPLDLSKVVYAELLDKDNRAILQTKVSLKDATGHGSLMIPPTINSGTYTFRAYTNWMKNFDADFYYEKNLTIINSLSAEKIAISANEPSYDIQFFPEGGNLVEGIESKIGVRAVNENGVGANFQGIIINQQNDTVANFQSLKFGITSFKFKPLHGNDYKAIMQLDNGSSVIKDIPKAFGRGYVLQLDRLAGGKTGVKVFASAELSDRPVYILIHTKQQLIASEIVPVRNNEGEFLIDESKLGDGISHVTIFDADKNPVCERLFFKRPTKKMLIGGSVDRQQYESRKKVAISIDVKNELQLPEQANMSVSVYKVDSFFTPQSQNIESFLWLTSDIKGTIESPEYYFANTGEEVDKATDNLMLTHGWRRFAWKDVLQPKVNSFAYLPEFEGHIVSATASNRLNGQPAGEIHNFMAIPGSHFHFYTGISDKQGRVSFYTKNFFGTHEIFAEAGGKTRDYKIDIHSPFSETYSSRKTPGFSLANLSGTALQSASISMQVQNVYSAEKLNNFSYPLTDTSSFFIPTRTYALDDYVRFPTMEEVLREYVQEVAVIKQNNKLRLEAGRRDAAGVLYRYEPLVLVDGVPLFDDPNKVFAYDPLKVKELQIMNRRYFLGAAVFEGILNFKTYSGRPEGFISDPNATVLDYEGVQSQREFFSPVYDNQAQVNSRMPDFRNLLHWAPVVKTNQSGKEQISFYTSDLSGKYMVVIEGISREGRAGTKTFSFDVVNPLFVQK